MRAPGQIWFELNVESMEPIWGCGGRNRDGCVGRDEEVETERGGPGLPSSSCQ